MGAGHICCADKRGIAFGEGAVHRGVWNGQLHFRTVRQVQLEVLITANSLLNP